MGSKVANKILELIVAEEAEHIAKEKKEIKPELRGEGI